MSHPALVKGRVAVVTGAASGIGLASARRFAGLGMKVCIADVDQDRLAQARTEILQASKADEADILCLQTDVARLEDVLRLKDLAYESFGDVAVLMNNAAIGKGAGPWEDRAQWQRLLDVNLFGVINGLQTFVPEMIARRQAGAIVITGSKQGITTPPGNAAYNVSKAAVKVLAEQTAHGLRQVEGGLLSAHLLIPGFTFTGMTSPGQTAQTPKPGGAWTPDQVVDVLVEGMAKGDFYLFCQDNETTREMDERRMQWAAGDVIENRPALSRWHPDYHDAFAAFMKQ